MARINRKRRATRKRSVIPARPAKCRNSKRNRLKIEFSNCLGAILEEKNENVHKLLLSEIHTVYLILKDLGMKKNLSPFLQKLGWNLPSLEKYTRQDVFSLGVPAECLRTSLQQLFAILQISNGSMLIRSEQALWLEARETFLRKFVYSLEFDKDNNVKDRDPRMVSGKMLMHWLVQRNEQTMLRLFLDRNVNMGHCDHEGQSPFHVACVHANEEIVAMFMYYNVSPNRSLANMSEEMVRIYYKLEFESGSNLICTASRYDNILEMLTEYVYDQWSDLDVNTFLELIRNESRCFSRFVEIQHANLSSIASTSRYSTDYDKFWRMLYIIPSSFLEKILVLMTTNAEAFDESMDCFSYGNWKSYWSELTLPRSGQRRNFLQNLHVLASTVYISEDVDEPKVTILQAMMNEIYHLYPLLCVMENYELARDQRIDISLDEIESIMLVLLSNGAPMDGYTMQLIFEDFGDSEFFNFCRSLHVDPIPYAGEFEFFNLVRLSLDGNSVLHVYARRQTSEFYYKFPGGKTMWQVVSDPAQSSDIESCIDYYTSMSSHPNVKRIAYGMNSEALTAKVNAQPEFPTLVELARDAARTYVVEKYRVRRSWQFYEAVKTLRIPEIFKRIIAYELDTPLYR